MKVYPGQRLCHLHYSGQMKDSYLPGGTDAVLSYVDILDTIFSFDSLDCEVFSWIQPTCKAFLCERVYMA